MRKILLFLLYGAILVQVCQSQLDATLVQVNGKWTDEKYAPIYSLKEHFDLGYRFVQENNWAEGLYNFTVITTHFPESEYYRDSLFFSGICYYFLNDYQLSNRQLSAYLNQNEALKYFDHVFLFKFYIAEAFRLGAKKHLFNWQPFPRLMPARKEALEIYDEVISAMPHQELGAKALFAKAELLKDQKKYKDSIDTLNILVKRFPRHEMAPSAYLLISEIYVDLSIADAQNPDLIALAKINLTHFKKDFPSDERCERAQRFILQMEETFASSLYETGRFYEKKKKLKASLIYYQEAVKRYPETESAEKCKERLLVLNS